MDKPIDFTQEIIAEAKIVLQRILTFEFVNKTTMTNDAESVINMITIWFENSERSSNKRIQHEEEIKVLALIAFLICFSPEHRGDAFQSILEERNRQIERGYTIARDKANYQGNELKRFALHRLTGLDLYYPFKDGGFKNTNGNHTEAERHIQAGAILLAHIQKNIAVNQINEWLKHATKDECNLELAKEVSDQ